MICLPNSVFELRGVRLEVSNGVGISNLARRTADRLATEGVLTVRLTNAKPYRQAKTEIQFVTGQGLAAQALQSRLPVAACAVAASRLNAGVQVRLVLGHDVTGRALAEWLDAGEEQQVATAMPGAAGAGVEHWPHEREDHCEALNRARRRYLRYPFTSFHTWLS